MKLIKRYEINGEKSITSYKGYRKTAIVLIFAIIIILVVSSLCYSEKIDTQGQEYQEYLDVSKNFKIEEDEIVKEKEEQIVIAKDEIDLISKKVSEIVGEKEKSYGIFYYDISSGLQYTLNSDKGFHPASTIKVPIAMMVEDKMSNEFTKDTKIAYENSDNCDGAGVLQGRISKGDELSVSVLLEYMIKDSDNIATSMLKKSVGDVSTYISDQTGITTTSEVNVITPRQSCILLKKIYDKSEENKNYRDIIDLMFRTNTHDRLDKYIPECIVAHKIGDYENYVNDVGIIFGKKPYILCIYTKDEMEEGRENIAKISKTIYDITSDKL